MIARLVIADDHPIVLDGLVRLLENEPGLSVVAACSDGEAVLEAVREHAPDLLILDLRMPRLDGLDVLWHLSRRCPAVPTIVLTAALDVDDVAEAVRLGTRGIVLKDMALNRLVKCVRTVLDGGEWFEDRIIARERENLIKREEASRQLLQALTSREVEIARLVACGLRNKEIAIHVGISEGTAKIHLHRIYEKLGISSRLELANTLTKKGL